MHKKAVIQIVKYLKTHKDEGLVFKSHTSKGLECYVDADFADNWSIMETHDRASVLLRTGFYIMLAGFPILYASILQTEIALSITKAEYIALSTEIHEVIPML